MDAKETESLGKELSTEQLLGQSKAEVGAGGILPPTLVNSLQPPPGPSPSRAPGRCKVRPAGQGSGSPGMAASCQMKRLLFPLAVLQLLGEYAQGPAAVASTGHRWATSTCGACVCVCLSVCVVLCVVCLCVCCRQPWLQQSRGSVIHSVPDRRTGEGISSRTQTRG